LAQFQVWNQRKETKKTLKFQLKLEPPWPSNKLGTGRMKEKECDPNASLAQYQVCNQRMKKIIFKNSTKTEVALVERQDWIQKNEKNGT
jgi:hypothetical protein